MIKMVDYHLLQHYFVKRNDWTSMYIFAKFVLLCTQHTLDEPSVHLYLQHIREHLPDNYLFFFTAAPPSCMHCIVIKHPLRFSIHRRVNCAPYRESSSLLILGEAPSLQHLLLFTKRMSSLPLAPNLHTTIQTTYTPLKHSTGIYTVLNIDLCTLVPVERPSDTIVPQCINTHSHTKLNL